MATPDRQQQLRERAGDLRDGTSLLLAALAATQRYMAAIRERAIKTQQAGVVCTLDGRMESLRLDSEALQAQQKNTIERLNALDIKLGSEAAALVYVDEMARGFALHAEDLIKHGHEALALQPNVAGANAWREPAAEAVAEAELAIECFNRLLGLR